MSTETTNMATSDWTKRTSEETDWTKRTSTTSEWEKRADAGNNLLLENGDYLLLEDGHFIKIGINWTKR